MWWQTVLDVLLDALLDSLIILPFLLAMNILIEVYEYKAGAKLKSVKLLNGAAAPLIGAGAGLIPQCGFSVVATKLYTTKRISLAALIAVYISTSDEAVPILLSNPATAVKLVPLLLIKLLLALIASYSVLLLTRFVGKKRLKEATVKAVEGAHGSPIQNDNAVIGCGGIDRNDGNHNDGNNNHENHNHENHNDGQGTACGCGCGCQTAKNATFFERFLVHPFIHSLKILLYIFAVNLVMGGIIEIAGEDALAGFLEQASFAQVPLAALVGLIPNCAASVVITQLYALGDLSLGAAVAGLSVNAGIAFTVLIKENKRLKESLTIILGILLFSIAAGIIITALF